MLAFAAYESAALFLVGDDFAFTLSREAAGGGSVASVRCLDDTCEAVAKASASALAILAAHADAIARECELVASVPLRRSPAA